MLHLIGITPNNTNIFSTSVYVRVHAPSLSLQQFAIEQVKHNDFDRL